MFMFLNDYIRYKVGFRNLVIIIVFIDPVESYHFRLVL
jgi:hypothetical protein